MCLIRVREEIDEEDVHPRLSISDTRRLANARSGTTTVITPIPPAPPPPPPDAVFSDALVPTTNRRSQGHGYVYDVGTNTVMETADGYTFDDRHRDYRASDSEYLYSVHDGPSAGRHGSSKRERDYYDDRGDRVKTTKTTIIKTGIGRSSSDAGHSHSRSRSHGVIRAASISSKAGVVIGPDGDQYVKTHHHRHRRRSGSIEREKSVTRFSHIDSREARQVVSGRHSNVSISHGHVSGVELSEPRSSFRYIEPRSSAIRGLESAEMVRKREAERFAYGGIGEHRRSGSFSYVHPDPGNRRAFNGGGRRSRDKVVVMDSNQYY